MWENRAENGAEERTAAAAPRVCSEACPMTAAAAAAATRWRKMENARSWP